MNKKTITISYLIVLLILGNVKAQDIFFSQFYASPLTLNPALTGLSSGDLRVALNYRDQSSNIIPISTQAASVDMRIFRSALQNDIASVGLVYVKDDQADGYLSSLNAMFSGAFHKSLGNSNNHFVSMGFQTGILQRSVDASKLTFNNQYNDVTKVFDASIPHGVNFQSEKETIFDIHGGIMWYHFIEKNSTIFAGVSAFHLLEPTETFLGNAEQLSRRYVFHGGRRIPFSETFSMIPNVLFMMQNNIYQISGGTSAELNIPDANTAFKLGAWYRHNDNLVIGSFGFRFRDIEVGVSYDILSSIQTISRTQGGLEFSLIYSPALKKVVKLEPDPGTSF